MRLLACVSGWNDVDLLRGCVESVAAAGLPLLYLDGAYETYAPDAAGTGRGWCTDHVAVVRALDAPGARVEHRPALADRPWADEAEKRTALVREGVALGPEWLLILDTDERLESQPGDLEAYLGTLLPATRWAYLNLYRPAQPSGYLLPRLLRATPGLRFAPPLDYQVYEGEERIAQLTPAEACRANRSAVRWTEVPQWVARIRHDRHLRPVDRVRQTAEYIARRRAAHRNLAGCA